MENRIVLCDIETFGLDPDTDPIIEIGFTVTDLKFENQQHFSWPVWMDRYNQLYNRHKRDDTFVYKMHEKSGLWEVLLSSDEGDAVDISPTAVEDRAVNFLKEAGVTKDDPLVGSSIQFDRSMLHAQMPEVEGLFSYRNIDISSFKETCRRFNPALYSKIEKYAPAKKLHRVLPDIQDSIAEFKFYLDNFLYVEI